jgi:hypothetical protein
MGAPVLALFTWEYNFTFYIFFRALGTQCGFDPTTVTVRDKPALSTSDSPLPTNFPLAEDVLKNNAPFDVGLLPLRDPDHFVSGQIHNYLDEWKFILEKDINDDKTCVLDWLEHGVDVNKFFRHFKGNFKGRHFDSNHVKVRDPHQKGHYS